MLEPKGYTNIGQIQNYLLHGIKEYFRPQVNHWIAQMEQYVEKETGRVFIADAVASTKKYQIELEYTPTVGRYLATQKQLFIDECVEISELKIDNVIVAVSDYLTYPINSLPITRIKLKDSTSSYFTKDEQNIEVKAKWGSFVECPPDIGFATTILVVGIINFSGDMAGEIKQEKMGDYSVTYKEQKDWQDFERAKQILRQYKKIII